MKKLLLAAVGTAALFAGAAPASAAALLPGGAVLFDPFVAAERGTELASMQTAGSADTVAGIYRSAVFRNIFGTLDFYYQVVHTGGDAIARITARPFGNFTTETFFDDGDVDGGGIFTAANNPRELPFPLVGTVPGNTVAESTATRSLDGNVVGVNFQVLPDSANRNDVGSGQTSSTYIFRTDATFFGSGTGGVIDGSTFFVPVFAPVPEPSTWAMMLVGFGAVGYSMRRRPKYRAVQAV